MLIKEVSYFFHYFIYITFSVLINYLDPSFFLVCFFHTKIFSKVENNLIKTSQLTFDKNYKNTKLNERSM